MFSTTPITFLILGATVLVSMQAFNNSAIFEKLLLSPWSVKHRRELYRLFSYQLIHADWVHLAFNMFTFYSFGRMLEVLFTNEEVFNAFFIDFPFWGKTKGILGFIVLYLGGGLVAALPGLRKHGDNLAYRAVGASGAVSAVMMAFMIMFPTVEIAFFFAIKMPAYIGAIVFFGMEHYLSRKGNTNIGHDAHIWGALFGILFVGVMNPGFYTRFVTEVSQHIGSLF